MAALAGHFGLVEVSTVGASDHNDRALARSGVVEVTGLTGDCHTGSCDLVVVEPICTIDSATSTSSIGHIPSKTVALGSVSAEEHVLWATECHLDWLTHHSH